jgi:hypothetical protein
MKKHCQEKSAVERWRETDDESRNHVIDFVRKHVSLDAADALEEIANGCMIKALCFLRQMVDEQAEDDGLWFVAQTAPEAYLQQELRRLHAAVEAVLGDSK